MAKEKKQSFESLQNRLEEIVCKLEEGGLELEESLKLFEEGTTLFAQCNKMLDSAQTRMDVLFEEADQRRVKPEESSVFDDRDDALSDKAVAVIDTTDSVGLNGDDDE